MIALNHYILIKQSKMGNHHIQVPLHVRDQWQEINHSHKKLVQNKYTSELFNFMVLSKVHEQKNISQLIERSIYSFPKTPKIIILNNQQGQLFILQQQFNLSLVQYIPTIVLPSDLLGLLEKMVQVVSCLYKKYGPFHVTENMVGLTKNYEVIAWINSQKYKNSPELPFQRSKVSEQTMIDEMIMMLQRYTKIQMERIIHRPFCRSFQQFSCFLSRQILKRKQQLSTMLKNNEKCIVRALSPQNNIGSLRLGMINKLPTRDIGQQKHEKKLITPRFIQKNKANIQFLDNLNHRRTNTIEQNQMSMILTRDKLSKSKSKHDVKRQRSSEQSLGKLKSVRTTSNTNKFNNLSFGSISRGVNPEFLEKQKIPQQRLTYSGYSNKNIKKRQFPTDLRFIKSCKNVESILTHSKKYDNQCPNTPNTPNSPNSSMSPQTPKKKSKLRRQFSLEIDNVDSCVFQSQSKILSSSSHAILPMSEGRIDELPTANTTQSKYLSEMKKTEVIIEQESHHNVSKTLEDEFNDFFSNPSKSPRFMLGPLKESLDLEREFERLIDM